MIISGKTAIVTGGASGMGEAAVLALFNAGARIVIADLDEHKGQALSERLGASAMFVKTDVVSTSDARDVCQAAVANFGALHILINNAGIGTIGRTLGKEGPLDIELFKKTIEVNLVGSFNMLSQAAWEMARNPDENGERGVIINTASIAAFEGQIGQVSYAASKAGLVGMTLPAARDLAGYGIRVNTIAPGIIDTPMLALLPDSVRRSLARQIPFPSRLGEPAEYGMLVQSLVENAYINGTCIRIDGGVRMGMR